MNTTIRNTLLVIVVILAFICLDRSVKRSVSKKYQRDMPLMIECYKRTAQKGNLPIPAEGNSMRTMRFEAIEPGAPIRHLVVTTAENKRYRFRVIPERKSFSNTNWTFVLQEVF